MRIAAGHHPSCPLCMKDVIAAGNNRASSLRHGEFMHARPPAATHMPHPHTLFATRARLHLCMADASSLQPLWADSHEHVAVTRHPCWLALHAAARGATAREHHVHESRAPPANAHGFSSGENFGQARARPRAHTAWQRTRTTAAASGLPRNHSMSTFLIQRPNFTLTSTNR